MTDHPSHPHPDDRDPHEFSLEMRGNRWFAAAFALACIVFAIVAARTDGGPWHGLAQFAGALAFAFALHIDVKSHR